MVAPGLSLSAVSSFFPPTKLDSNGPVLMAASSNLFFLTITGSCFTGKLPEIGAILLAYDNIYY